MSGAKGPNTLPYPIPPRRPFRGMRGPRTIVEPRAARATVAGDTRQERRRMAREQAKAERGG